ncbi:MAG: excinuclease ABC subunit UvrC [Desulfobacterales bacterium]|nr:excinuclease ABC subunit UvrC [Desulfobacterales bacterium]
MESLKEKISSVSSSPGVYIFKDDCNSILYIGKAKNLKKRISSYFSNKELDLKTSVLVKKISNFETIITSSEKEALLLEASLIRKHKPRYNIVLKDDKRHISLRLDIQNPFPSLSIARKIVNDKAQYFGPYPSAYSAKQTLKLINKTFKLKKCSKKELPKRSRPCLNHQMGICLGPCCNEVDQNEYNNNVKEVVLFLKNRTSDLVKKIETEMYEASESLDFEKAAKLRDKLLSLKNTLEKQVAVTTDFTDRDVIVIEKSENISLVTVLYVRSGFISGTQHFSFYDSIQTDSEIIESFIRQYYEKNFFIPDEIFVQYELENKNILIEWLKAIKGKKIEVLWPQRGEKLRLIEIASQNAKIELKNKIDSSIKDTNILERLQKKLKINKFPQRIECFDNSNLSGTEPVASMVVFENGKPNKALYRKYKINNVNIQNDYAYMEEVLKRRYGKGEKSKPFPDILMVDGGKGHLNIALSVINELKLENEFYIISIAKKDEQKNETQDKIYKPMMSNPVMFGRETDLLFFLQRIRDEAHRFVISFQRDRRKKTSITSILDSIPGIGENRKKFLLRHFGSIKRIREATIEEICSLPGINEILAKAIKEILIDS